MEGSQNIELRKTRKTKNLKWRKHKKGSQNVGKSKIPEYLIGQLSKHVIRAPAASPVHPIS